MPKKTNKTPKKTAVKQPKLSDTATPVVSVPVPVVVAPAPVKTGADKIWDEIKNLPIEMFALPNQTVSQHCSPFPVDPDRLYLTIRSTATLPSLEVAIGKGFVVEQADRFVIVSRAPAPLPVPPKR